MMEAFLELQRNVYQMVALAKYGNADIRHLSSADREEFELQVVVRPGSSDQSVDLTDVISKLGTEIIGHMDARDIVIVMLGAGLLWAGTAAWRAYLNARKEVRLAEVASEDKRRHLEAMEFASQQETERMKALVSVMGETYVGSRVLVASDNIHDGLLKAAASAPAASILSQEVTTRDAQELRASPRRRATLRIIEQEMKVVDVNTANPMLMSVVLSDPVTDEQMSTSFGDAILSDNGRKALFMALENRTAVWVRMKVKDLEGEIQPVEILSVEAAAAETAARI